MRTTTRRIAALTIVSALSLAGCGGSSDGESSTSSSKPAGASSFDAEPATGASIEGTDYTFSAPEGWEAPTADIPGFDFDSLAADGNDADGFADNINVVRQSPRPAGLDTDDLGKTIGDELTKQGMKDVKTQEPVTIDGEQAAHVSLSQELNGNKNLTEQYYLVHNDALYVITFSHSTTVSQADRDKIAGSVLATWKWS